ANEYLPSRAVAAVCVAPVPAFLACTFAPSTGLPKASATEPESEPVWEKTGRVRQIKGSSKRINPSITATLTPLHGPAILHRELPMLTRTLLVSLLTTCVTGIATAQAPQPAPANTALHLRGGRFHVRTFEQMTAVQESL